MFMIHGLHNNTDSWIFSDISRNCLLGNRKKIAKFLMRTFTCRSTFLCALLQPSLPPSPFALFSISESVRDAYVKLTPGCHLPQHVYTPPHPYTSAGIFKQSLGDRNRVGIGLSYRPAWLHRLEESTQSIHCNRFLGSWNVYKYRLGSRFRGIDSGSLRSLAGRDTTSRVVVRVRQAGNRFLSSLKDFKICGHFLHVSYTNTHPTEIRHLVCFP